MHRADQKDSGKNVEVLPHINSLDGFRGAAIVLVMIYHFFMGWPFWGGAVGNSLGHLLRTGWVGVDLFFVLSGFLITGILLDTRNDENRWRNFLIRRSLRIFPLFYMALLLSFILIPFLSRVIHAIDWSPLLPPGGTAGCFFSYLSNFPLAHPDAQYPLHLSVTWSLSVEEQFYLVWPLIVWLTPPRHAVRMMVGAIVAAQLFKLTSLYFAPAGTHVEYFTWCRLDEFGFGALIAAAWRERLLSEPRWAWIRQAGFWVAAPAAFVMVAAHHWLSPTVFLFGQVLVSWAAAACILTFLSKPASPFSRGFDNWLLRRFGKYSYCMYLLHGLLVPFLGIATVPRDVGAVALLAHVVVRLVIYFLVVYLVSALSFMTFEKPIQDLKRFFKPSTRSKRAAA